jgi:hypothetical protein
MLLAGFGEILAGVKTAPLPIGMFQILLLAKGCFNGSRSVAADAEPPHVSRSAMAGAATTRLAFSLNRLFTFGWNRWEICTTVFLALCWRKRLSVPQGIRSNRKEKNLADAIIYIQK